mgnify:CR=1 FL=1
MFVKSLGMNPLTFDFAMQGVTTKKFIVFLLFNPVRLLALVARAHVAGYRFALFAGFRAFKDDVLSWHGFKIFVVIRKPLITQFIRPKRKLFLISSACGLR